MAHVDALFDRGVITFNDDGVLLAAAVLPAEALALLGFAGALRRELAAEKKGFLAFHRTVLCGKIKPEAATGRPSARAREE